MKTKQEQIEEMAKIVDEMYNVYTTTAEDIAEGIYNAGYRKEQETAKEIEQLKAENEKYLDSIESVQAGRCRLRCQLTEQAVKQAKIDVLNELRNRLVVYYPSVISVIDKLIKEYEE